MREEFKYEGLWWLPSDPDRQVGGTVQYIPSDGIELDFIGNFTDDIDFKNQDIILGLLKNGDKITLYNCTQLNFSTNTNGISTATYSAQIAFGKVHFTGAEDLSIKKLSFQCSNLNEWASHLSGYDLSVNKGTSELTLKYKIPDPIKFTLDPYEIAVSVRASMPGLPLSNEFVIRQQIQISLTPDKDQDFFAIMADALSLRNFLSLCVGRPLNLREVKVTSEHSALQGSERILYPEIEIYYPGVLRTEDQSTLSSRRMLLPLSDIEHRIGEVVGLWFKKSDELGPVFDLYFSTIFAPELYIHQQFLSLVQAVEAYHRRAVGTVDLSPDEHNARIEKILEAVPNGHKSWLKGKLRYSNEVSLRKRIKELIDLCEPFLGDYIDKSKFAHKTVTTRNYLTHYDESLESQAAKGIALFFLCEKLKTLLEISFMRELCLDDDKLESVVKRIISRRRYHRTADLGNFII